MVSNVYDFSSYVKTSSKVIAFASSKGGVGKSTLAITFASYLAHASAAAVKADEEPLSIVVVDFDVHDGNIGFLTGHSKPSLINLCVNGLESKVLKQTIIKSLDLKVDLLLAPKRPRSADYLSLEFYAKLLEKLKKKYDYVIVDTASGDISPFLAKVVYREADQIIAVTDMNVSSVFSMTRWVQEVSKTKANGGMGINPKKIGIVVNKAIADVNVSSGKIERAALGLPIIAVFRHSLAVVNYSNKQNLVGLFTDDALGRGLHKLTRAVTGQKMPKVEEVLYS